MTGTGEEVPGDKLETGVATGVATFRDVFLGKLEVVRADALCHICRVNGFVRRAG